VSSPIVRLPVLEWGETGALLAFGLQAMLPVLAMAGILLFVDDLPGATVYGRIVPAACLTIFLGALYLAWLARRLAATSGRADVTALPSGISLRHAVVSTFVVMWPVADKTHDATAAWAAGLAWTFMHGVILIVGGFLVPLLRGVLPRVAFLGALAGAALGVVVLPAAVEIADAPVIGLACLAVVLLEGLGGTRILPRVPSGVLVAVVGLVLGWAFVLAKVPVRGFSLPDLKSALSGLHLSVPWPPLDILLRGFDHFGVLLATALPFALYDLLDSLNNVESAETAGDSYPAARVLVGNGVVTLIGSLLGCPAATAIYVGHPGWKALGARTGYAAGAGFIALLAGCLGVASLATALVPPVALMAVILFAGLWSITRALQEVPARHLPAFVLAIVPWIVSWTKFQIDNALGATGTAVELLGVDKVINEGLIYPGVRVLADGPTLIGMVLAAIAAFVVDRQFLNAAAVALAGAVLTFFGIMHAESYFDAIHAEAAGIGRSLPVAIAYLAAAAVLLIVAGRTNNSTR
jgi:adenine/guanine/hypoxanthine permease